METRCALILAFSPGFLMWGVVAHYRRPLGAILSPPHLNGYTDQEKKKKSHGSLRLGVKRRRGANCPFK